MMKIAAALAGGVIIGVAAMLVGREIGFSNQQRPVDVVRDIVAVPKMTPDAANTHRDENYANLTSIEEIYELPSEFARSEALYVLAGRSDSAGVQRLIFETNRIADDVERVDLLGILFFRLAETDPQSALAVARTDQFESTRSMEKIVWRTWARKNLDDALFAAKTQTSKAAQSSAAQSLYAAFGFMGNETTDKIEAELGIRPNRSTRAQYLYLLANRSPAEAIDFINGHKRDREQRQYVSLLANYLSAQDPYAALSHVEQFDTVANRKYFGDIVDSQIARENPRAVIEQLLASGRSLQSSGEFRSALSELVKTDLETVQQYFEGAGSSEVRQMMGSVIVMELAKTNPTEAIEWARANDSGQYPYLQMSALRQIAETDPQQALTEALATENSAARENLVSTVVQSVAQQSPSDAVLLLDQLQDNQLILNASQRIVSSWLREDPDAAIAWVLSREQPLADQMMQRVSHRILDTDIDAAMRLLSRLDGPVRENMRQQIATRLATNRSPADAQSFISQFEGQPGYDQLQASLITGVAQTDALLAKQLADQMGDGAARDRAYVQIIGQRAQTNPVEAAQWLNSVGDSGLRGLAAGQLATQWFQRDPIAAGRWVSDLPAGASRDDAIMHLSSRWRDPSAEQQELIASIEDADKRGQAKIRQVYNLMQTDPASARKLLDDPDISDTQRQQVELMISQSGLRF